MTTATGSAMQMQLTLASLMRRHGAIDATPCIFPLASPIDGTVDISGLASTTDIDLTRQKFRGWAFSNLCLYLKGYSFPKLLYRHDESEVAGESTKLSYDDRGQLRICAQVSHEMAKRCSGFSVTARILEYEIRDADSPDFHAVISNAEIVEISLTDRPANPRALVLSRTPAAPTAPLIQAMGQQTDLAISAVGLIQRQLEILQQTMLAPAEAGPKRGHKAADDVRSFDAPRAQARRPPVITTPRRPTQFSALAAALNERTA